MEKLFINTNGVIRAFYIEGDKVLTKIELNGAIVINPTIEQFESVGWREYKPEPDEGLAEA